MLFHSLGYLPNPRIKHASPALQVDSLLTEPFNTTRRDKKAFFNEQAKEIEENNRMRKTKDLFQDAGDVKFHKNISCKVGMIMDRKGKDLRKT